MMMNNDPDFFLSEPITAIHWSFIGDYVSGRLEFAGRGPLYFLVIQRDNGSYQCWNCGDDVSPLAYPEEAIPFGDPGPTPWRALPAAIRHRLDLAHVEGRRDGSTL
jgi:hypothetical protein